MITEVEQSSEDAATIRSNQILSDSDFAHFPDGAGPNSLPIRSR